MLDLARDNSMLSCECGHLLFCASCSALITKKHYADTAISIKVVPKTRERVEYERERLIGKD